MAAEQAPAISACGGVVKTIAAGAAGTTVAVWLAAVSPAAVVMRVDVPAVALVK